MTNEQLLEQIQALKELISIQKQTIDALKAQPPKVEYRYSPWYSPLYTQPYISQPYVYGSGGGGTYQQGANANSTVTATPGTGSLSIIDTNISKASSAGFISY